jgi:molecular chaperone DnaK (HSP70)
MIRLAFAAAGVKYEDCRLTREEFEELKASKFKYIITGCFKTLQLYFKCYFIHICSQ